MKILTVNTMDITGGAARAAYRLHRGLLEQGVNSRMLVQFKKSDDPTVDTVYSDSRLGKLYSHLRPSTNKLLQKLQKTSNPAYHSVNFLPSGLQRKINNSDADIVHLHWLGGEMISIKELAKIRKPIVWTFHDMWAFSGAEHYHDLHFPDRAKKKYKKENRPHTYSGIDIDRWTWLRKKKYWHDKNLHLVTPSNWLADHTRKSELLGGKNIQTIPNGLNLDIYKPISRKRAREIINITDNNDTRYIIFGAMSATSDIRKGFQKLKEALTILEKNTSAHHQLLIFGSEGYKPIDFGLPTTYLGYLNDEETLAFAYSAADVMVVPSLQDNLPNTAVEAISCGTPVVAFNTGGLPDIIAHKENGYLAEPYEAKDLAEGIAWVLKNDERVDRLSRKARQTSKEKFDIRKITHQYMDLYSKILKE